MDHSGTRNAKANGLVKNLVMNAEAIEAVQDKFVEFRQKKAIQVWIFLAETEESVEI